MNSVSLQRRVYNPNPPKFWVKRDEGVTKFFVYILLLEGGELYIGQTRELRERMLEHRNGVTASTAGKNPKLKYFEITTTRELAMLREHELKKIVRNNRREVFRMITTFQDLVSEID
jgi:predicted GIY-YIG superfamily endonuclease